MDSARYDIVSGSFRSWLYEYRSLNFGESLLIEIVTCALDYLMSESQVSLHFVLSEVEISVLESQIIIYVVVVLDIDRRSFGCRVNRKVACEHFDVSGRDVRVFGRPFLYNALYTYAVLAAEALRLLDDFLRSVLIERYLSDPRFVTDIYKDQSAEASGLGHPAIKHNVLTLIGKSQLTAHMSSLIKHLRDPPF